jgi:hypothetical protein
MENPALLNLIANALLCPSLRAEELPLLHMLHLRLVADIDAGVSDDERQRLEVIISHQRCREGR